MSIVNTLALESNRQIKINFAGGDLSSDAGLLLVKEFVSKLGIDKVLGRNFKTNDSAVFRFHTDRDNLLQMIYMIIAGYFEDDASDELTNDPVFKSILDKKALASQPTISRFFNRMDEDTLNQFLEISKILRKKIYSIQMPEAAILDLDWAIPLSSSPYIHKKHLCESQRRSESKRIWHMNKQMPSVLSP